MKFGGTSVASKERWLAIGRAVEEAARDSDQVLVVCSAVSGISDLLEKLCRVAPTGGGASVLQQIEQRHRSLAEELGLTLEPVQGFLEELSRLATGMGLTGECSPRLRARVLACGELMSTTLGAAFLGAKWHDARELLVSVDLEGQRNDNHFLEAVCEFERDPSMESRLGEHPVVITQGFIASDSRGHTVLLGRGGSDTSASYFAAKLGAARLEIWTDVAGMYTADPRRIPTARLLKELDYREAQELATVGAKVLHPRSLEPCRSGRIPIQIRCTPRPDLGGTIIRASEGATTAAVKAVSSRNRVVVVSMETLGMWQQAGFLAEVFQIFGRHRISVDLVTTSQTNVTVTLDEPGDRLEDELLNRLLQDLSQCCRPKIYRSCAAVSLVGSRIRSILHRIGSVLEVFEDEVVHMVCQSSSDLNLTFVVDEEQAPRLVKRLHSLLFSLAQGDVFGPTWQAQTESLEEELESPTSLWWEEESERNRLLKLAGESTPRFVYHLETVRNQARKLRSLTSLDRILYAIKANAHPDLLKVAREQGLGFECVSPGELDHLKSIFPDLQGDEVLYTPNFASRADYEAGFAHGVHVTLDNLAPLRLYPEVFRGRRLFVRMDPGKGGGHHRHVRTAGPLSKFGVSADQLDELEALLKSADAHVVGLHAHSGSGIKDPAPWLRVARYLLQVAERFPEVEILDLGGGLGVPEKPGEAGLPFKVLGEQLARFKEAYPNYKLWLEPGRYLVANAGVLITRVTQLKRKGEKRFVGVDVGMNSLIRPALYGAYHHIENLSQWRRPYQLVADVVGPICETGDVLGHDRKLPETTEGDVLLIGTAGAYGRVMSSTYNLRPPAEESVLS